MKTSTTATTLKNQTIFIDDDSLATLNNYGYKEVSRTVTNINTNNRHSIPCGEIKIKGQTVEVEQNLNGKWELV